MSVDALRRMPSPLDSQASPASSSRQISGGGGGGSGGGSAWGSASPTRRGTTGLHAAEGRNPLAIVGPFDFAWLLEKVADFSGEDGRSDAPQRAEPPPPPLQLHIPETLLFAEGRPKMMFYTDRGGYVRGARRQVRCELTEVFELLSRVVRKRRNIERECRSAIPGVEENVPPPAAPRERMPASRMTVNRSPEVAKLWRTDGQMLMLSDPELVGMLAEVRAGNHSWREVRMLQTVFWAQRDDDESGHTVYQYDARTKSADIDYPQIHGLKPNPNEWERTRVFNLMDDRNLCSAVPVIISQHTSYHCGLELVTGTFEFIRDCMGQQWLLDARDMHFIPNSSRRAAMGGAGAIEEPEKLLRYLSEEALLNTHVADKKGTQFQGMMETLVSHYTHFKEASGCGELLRREFDTAADVSVPLLQNTDTEKLGRTFNERRRGSSTGHGRFSAARPKSCGSSPRCRVPVRTPPLKPQPAGSWAPRSSSYWSDKASRETVHTSRGGNSGTANDLSTGGGGNAATNGNAGIEIVATAVMQGLLENAGPCCRPTGPTLDVLSSELFETDGQGLKPKKHRPRVRLVRVPPPQHQLEDHKFSLPARRRSVTEPERAQEKEIVSPRYQRARSAQFAKSKGSTLPDKGGSKPAPF